jgi:hypothetical protein
VTEVISNPFRDGGEAERKDGTLAVRGKRAYISTDRRDDEQLGEDTGGKYWR